MITRDSGYADRFRSYRIILDGKCIGDVAPGGELRANVSAEQHVLEARIDWCGSEAMRLNVTGDHRVVVRSALRGWRVLLVIFYIIFLRRSYLVLDLDPPVAG